MRSINWSGAPEGATPVQRRNYLLVQIDGFGVGLEVAAATFLPVFLARLGASNFEIGLLTAMPAFTGLLLSIPAGRFLQSHGNVVAWHSRTRLLYVSSYAVIGVASLVLPGPYVIPALLAIRMVATFSLTLLAVAFTVVMNAVAGPTGRYALMSRRWSIGGITSALAVMTVGQILNRLEFPTNYQLVLIFLSSSGLISYFSSIRIQLPDPEPASRAHGLSFSQRVKGSIDLIRREPAFISFNAKWFVYAAGLIQSIPLFPLYYVNTVQATDAWIGIINSVQAAVAPLGYLLWARQIRARGSRFVMLSTTLALALYPALTALTHRVEWIALYAGLSGIFAAGLNLVSFDELMKTVPTEYSAFFVSLTQTLQNFSAVATPLLGTLLADQIGLGGALVVSGLLRLTGFGLFAFGKGAAGQ